MKKTLLLSLFALTLSLSAYSQAENNEDNNKKNFSELKLNGIFLIAGAIEVTYEHTLNEESGLGITALIPFDNEITDDIKYFISPYYRFYFGNKHASGFYIEGFGMLNSTNRNIEIFEEENDDFRSDFAFGFGLGGKWVSKSGFIGEIGLGVGRNLFNNNDTENDIIGKGGLLIGYRF